MISKHGLKEFQYLVSSYECVAWTQRPWCVAKSVGAFLAFHRGQITERALRNIIISVEKLVEFYF